MCHVVSVASVLGSEKSAVSDGPLFVWSASEHMYCTLYTIALCFASENGWMYWACQAESKTDVLI